MKPEEIELLKKQNAEYLEALQEIERYFTKKSRQGKWAKRLHEKVKTLLK